MTERKSDFLYKMMVNVGMPIRNIFMPPEKMLEETDLKPGYQVLDYGCGPGTFSLRIANRVGSEGFVHALDIHPLAKKYIERKIRRKNLSNINVILSDCSTELSENSIDYVIMFDVFHELANPGNGARWSL